MRYPVCRSCGSAHVLWVTGTRDHVSCTDCGGYGQAEMHTTIQPVQLALKSIEFKKSNDPDVIAHEISLEPAVRPFPTKGSKEKN